MAHELARERDFAGLLAIPLSFFNPRSGRSFHLIAALLIYLIYSNLLSVSHAWVLAGKLSPWVGLWSVHLILLFLITYFYHWRLSLNTFQRWRRK